MEAGSNFKFGGWLTKQRSLQCSCTERTGYRGGQTAADFLVVISCITNCIYIFFVYCFSCIVHYEIHSLLLRQFLGVHEQFFYVSWNAASSVPIIWNGPKMQKFY